MNKNSFKEYICRPYCVFFKDGEKEEMACHGAVIAQRLVKNQKISLQYLDKNSGVKEEADLIRLVCADCPFEANDCDFRSSSPPEGSLPCGGYVLLYLLMSKNLVTIKDVEDACNEKS